MTAWDGIAVFGVDKGLRNAAYESIITLLKCTIFTLVLQDVHMRSARILNQSHSYRHQWYSATG